VVSLVVVAVYAALAYVVMRMPITRDWFPPASRSQSLRSTATFFFTAHFHVELVVYGAIFAIAHAMRSTSELRAREREALQPVVENALKHGVAARMDPTTVDIRATTAGGRLRVSVYNDGPLLRHTLSTASSRFGLRNVRERLATLDAGATLTLENVGTSGVRASVDMRAMAAADEQRGAISA